MTFRVGQRVICVDASDSSGITTGVWEAPLVKGHVYTISAIGLTHILDPQQLPCVHVEELERNFNEPLWAHRFRPIIERTTDISIFTEMLTKTGVDA